MNKKILFSAMAILCASMMAVNISIAAQSEKIALLALSSVALAGGGEDEVSGGESGGTMPSCQQCGNCTFIPHMALLQSTCFPNLQTHNKCQQYDDTCCNPSEQTSCNGIKG